MTGLLLLQSDSYAAIAQRGSILRLINALLLPASATAEYGRAGGGREHYRTGSGAERQIVKK